jgi:hypothetical protein
MSFHSGGRLIPSSWSRTVGSFRVVLKENTDGPEKSVILSGQEGSPHQKAQGKGKRSCIDLISSRSNDKKVDKGTLNA